MEITVYSSDVPAGVPGRLEKMLPEVFSELPGPLREALAGLAEPLELRAGETIYEEGDAADALFFLEEGWVRLYRLEADGREATVLVLEPGELFGEEALAGEGTRATGAETLAPSRVLRFEREGFLRLWREHGQLALWTLARLAERLRGAQRRYRERRYHEVLPRLARLLIEQMRPGREGLEVTLSHEQMGHLVGASRDTVTRALGELAMRDLLEINYRRIVILDVEAVRALALERGGAS